MSKVYVLETTDADKEVHTVSVYASLDLGKIAAQAWWAEQLAEHLAEYESEPTPMLEWQDHIEVSCLKNPDDYEERIYIWVREVITQLPE